MRASGHRVPQSNPFPGIRPYQEGEEYLFFGRENQVDRMVDTLFANRFLAVVGSSGCGKSSLVNCGLRPALRGGMMTGVGTDWRIAQFRPGSDPIGAMTQALSEDGVLFSDFRAEGMRLDEIVETTLRMSRLGIADLFRQAPLPEDTNLLIVVDQFEELFRYRRLVSDRKMDEFGISEEATAFINLLLEARHQSERIYVVMTMRSDFLGDCPQFVGLPEAINDGQFLVPRMTRDERRLAVTGPIRVGGAEISPVLLTRLVNDVGDNPDQLSILQHALNRTWSHWEESTGRRGPIDQEHYRHIGTMEAALDQHANQAYESLQSERHREICKQLFKILTDTASDSRGIRRPTKLGPSAKATHESGTICELVEARPGEIKKVIDVFRSPGRSFLMPPYEEPLTHETVIDISHESLMRVWEKLREWAEEEARSAQMYRRISETASLYQRGAAALWKDPDLMLALTWRNKERPTEAWARLYDQGFDNAMAFLDQSKSARSRERWKWFATVCISVVSIALLYLVLRSANRETEARNRVATLVDARPDAVPYVIELLKPFKDKANKHLRERLGEESLSRQINAACALAEFEPLSPELRSQLVAFIPKTTALDSVNLIRALNHDVENSRQVLRNKYQSENKLPVRVRWASALLSLGDRAPALEMLDSFMADGDPNPRTVFIETYAIWPGPIPSILDQTAAEPSSGFRSGICLAFSQLDKSILSNSDLELLEQNLRNQYGSVVDSAMHSAVRYTLTRLGMDLPAIAATSGPTGNREWFHDRHGITFIRIPKGTYSLGDESAESSFGKPRTARLSHSVFLGDCEITYGQFRSFANSGTEDGPREWNDTPQKSDGFPVENVTYDDTIRFCNWLSKENGLVPYYVDRGDGWTPTPSSDGYRLPFESEWEVACRARTTTRFSFGDEDSLLDRYAVYNQEESHECRSKLPNPWGFFDMHGNLTERCNSEQKDEGIGRGGDYWDSPEEKGNLVSFRSDRIELNARPTIGFRVARGVQEILVEKVNKTAR